MKQKFKIHYVKEKELGRFIGMNYRAAKELHFHHPLLHSDKDILIDRALGKRMRKKVILHEEVEDLSMRPAMHYCKADSYALSEEHFAK